MSKDRIALVAVVLAFFLVEGIQHIPGVRSAPVVTTHYQITGAGTMSSSQNGVVSMIWLMGDDGKLAVCEGSEKGSLTVQCSRPVTP